MGKTQDLQFREDMKRAERPGLEAVPEPRFHTSCWLSGLASAKADGSLRAQPPGQSTPHQVHAEKIYFLYLMGTSEASSA